MNKRTAFKKIAMALVAMSVFTGLLGGCSNKKESVSEIDLNAPLSIENIREGIYIMSTDGEFYYPNRDGQNFKAEVLSSNASRIICSLNDTKYIPTLYADDSLVYFTLGSIPSSFGVEKFCDSGYTCGLFGISKGSNRKYTFSKDNLIGESMLVKSLNGFMQAGDIFSILSLDDRDIEDSDVTPAGTIQCEKLGQKRKISFMKGTFYNEVETVADMHIWYSEETSNIPSYETTKNGFIILRLPTTITDGDYVSIMGTGLFRVSKDDRPHTE